MAFQLTEFLDNLYTTTWQKMKDAAADQIFDATPFWAWMKQNNRFKRVEGGRWIAEPLQYAKNELISWIGKGGTVSLNDFEHLTVAKYDWKYLAASIVRFGTDDQQNRGKAQIMSLLNSKLSNTQDSLVDELETRLAAGSASSSGLNAFDGLQYLVPDDPTASAEVGGIDQATYTWWRSNTKNMTGISFAASGVAEMTTMLNNCAQNKRSDRPDIILSGQTPYEYYEDEARTIHRITDAKMAELGFDHQVFKGIPMVWSPAVANTRMYFLNTKFLYFVYDPIMFFDMTEWKPIPDQPNDRAAQIVTACQFITNRRRVHGVLHTIDTA